MLQETPNSNIKTNVPNSNWKGSPSKNLKNKPNRGRFQGGYVIFFSLLLFLLYWVNNLSLTCFSWELQLLSCSFRFQKSKFHDVNNGKRGSGFPKEHNGKGLNFSYLLPQQKHFFSVVRLMLVAKAGPNSGRAGHYGLKPKELKQQPER